MVSEIQVDDEETREQLLMQGFLSTEASMEKIGAFIVACIRLVYLHLSLCFHSNISSYQSDLRLYHSIEIQFFYDIFVLQWAASIDSITGAKAAI